MWFILLCYLYKPSRSCLPSCCASPISISFEEFSFSLFMLYKIVEHIACCRFVHIHNIRQCSVHYNYVSVPVNDQVTGTKVPCIAVYTLYQHILDLVLYMLYIVQLKFCFPVHSCLYFVAGQKGTNIIHAHMDYCYFKS